MARRTPRLLQPRVVFASGAAVTTTEEAMDASVGRTRDHVITFLDALLRSRHLGEPGASRRVAAR